MSKLIHEKASALASVTSTESDGLDIRIITPGWGSSGYYAPEVLEAAAADKVFPAGTHMYFDHPTESESIERPERSVLALGAVLSEDATWDGTQLHAKAVPLAPYRELLEDATFQKAVGVSIRAAAQVSEGEAAGRTGQIIEKIVPSNSTSVDFVTHAGRGGAFGAALESARPHMVIESAVRRGVSEATVNDQREALSTVLRDAYNAENTWVWLRDFDDTTAWFEVEDNDGAAVWQQDYTKGDDGLANSVSGERIEVRAITQYVPVNPAGRSTESHRGDDMGTTQIEESELSGLREAAGRVTTLESERDTAIQRAEVAEAKVETLEETVAARTRRDRAAEIVAAEAKAADLTLTPLEVKGLVVDLPVKEGALDEDAFTKTVQSELTSLAESGRVQGFGATGGTTAGEVSEAEFLAAFGKKEA